MLNPKIEAPLNQPTSDSLTLMPETYVGQPITDDLKKLLVILPPTIRETLEQHPKVDELIEVVMDLGRIPEARFPNQSIDLGDIPINKEDLNHCIANLGSFSEDNRAGIERTLHRISAIRNRTGRLSV